MPSTVAPPASASKKRWMSSDDQVRCSARGAEIARAAAAGLRLTRPNVGQRTCRVGDGFDTPVAECCLGVVARVDLTERTG